MKSESRHALLTAIAKARGWIDDIRLSRTASFAEIARCESLGERHIRLLAPLAFLSPRIIAAIVDGSVLDDSVAVGPVSVENCLLIGKFTGISPFRTRLRQIPGQPSI